MMYTEIYKNNLALLCHRIKLSIRIDQPFLAQGCILVRCNPKGTQYLALCGMFRFKNRHRCIKSLRYMKYNF